MSPERNDGAIGRPNEEAPYDPISATVEEAFHSFPVVANYSEDEANEIKGIAIDVLQCLNEINKGRWNSTACTYEGSEKTMTFSMKGTRIMSVITRGLGMPDNTKACKRVVTTTRKAFDMLQTGANSAKVHRKLITQSRQNPSRFDNSTGGKSRGKHAVSRAAEADRDQ